MTEGIWNAVAGVGVAIAAGFMRVKRSNNTKPSDIPKQCPAHSGLVEKQAAMHEDIGETKKAILGLQGGQLKLLSQTSEIKVLLEAKK